jgi:hypothetical protein
MDPWDRVLYKYNYQSSLADLPIVGQHNNKVNFLANYRKSNPYPELQPNLFFVYFYNFCVFLWGFHDPYAILIKVRVEPSPSH